MAKIKKRKYIDTNKQQKVLKLFGLGKARNTGMISEQIVIKICKQKKERIFQMALKSQSINRINT